MCVRIHLFCILLWILNSILKLCLMQTLLQEENLDLAFKAGESVGITATLVRQFRHCTSDNFKSIVGVAEELLVFLQCLPVTDCGGDAEGRWSRLAEGSGLCGKYFPSL